MHDFERRAMRERRRRAAEERETAAWLLARVREGMIEWTAYRWGWNARDPGRWDSSELERAHEIERPGQAVRLYLETAQPYCELGPRAAWRELYRRFRSRYSRDGWQELGDTMRRALLLMAGNYR